MRDIKQISVAKILGTRTSRFLTYPTVNKLEAKNRIKELDALGVSALQLCGGTLIDGVPLLGKGCVGIVMGAVLDGAPVALKIRRMDANRPNMMEEARLLRLANSVDVGPRLITATRNFLAMELFDGERLYRWAERSPTKRSLTRVLGELLQACFRLDAIGLDHGELSHAPKNVLVSRQGKPCIVDFETASTSRRPANVTSLLQYFLFGELSRLIGSCHFVKNKKLILKALKAYKQEGSVANFQEILETLF